MNYTGNKASVKAKKLVSLENYLRSKRQYTSINVEASKSISKCISIYCVDEQKQSQTLDKKRLGGKNING